MNNKGATMDDNIDVELETLAYGDLVRISVRKAWQTADEDVKKQMRFIVELGLRGDSNFQSMLIRLICKADRRNLHLLNRSYPLEVAATMGVLRYTSFGMTADGEVLDEG
jgi:hypothetical protein